jgi:hypothetical protein
MWCANTTSVYCGCRDHWIIAETKHHRFYLLSHNLTYPAHNLYSSPPNFLFPLLFPISVNNSIFTQLLRPQTSMSSGFLPLSYLYWAQQQILCILPSKHIPNLIAFVPALLPHPLLTSFTTSTSTVYSPEYSSESFQMPHSSILNFPSAALPIKPTRTPKAWYTLALAHLSSFLSFVCSFFTLAALVFFPVPLIYHVHFLLGASHLLFAI